jgi:molecular chaperone HtpG
MTWDAQKMRAMLNDNKKRTAEEVLDAILDVGAVDTEKEAHFFKVILTGISKDSSALLDATAIQDYLSFEVPVPYDSAFMFYRQILDHADKLGSPIDEYPIYIDGHQIFKQYRTRIYASGKIHDEIKSIDFQDFYDENDNLIAWMWFGLSSFNGQIKSENIQRGLRLRKDNIQIGSARALRDQRLFPDNRANEYFIGEVFAVHPDLIPNARRDYFNENTVRTVLESRLKEFFIVLWKLCNVASDERSDYRKIREYHNAAKLYQEKAQTGFAGSVERETLDTELEKKKEIAEKAKKRLERPISTISTSDNVTVELTQRVKSIVSKVESENTPDTSLPMLPAELSSDKNGESEKSKPKYLTDGLSQYTRETRRVVGRIYDVINQTTPDFAEELISKIQTALKSKKE